MEVLLVMFREGGEHRHFRITKPSTVIGRKEDSDLRIAVGDVSRKHCRVVVEDDAVRVEDLGSSNGTFVNGTRTQEQELHPGDTLQVGPVAFVVQIDGVPELGAVRPTPKAAPKPQKPATADIDAELDELSILNDSSGDSGIADIDLDIDDKR